MNVDHSDLDKNNIKGKLSDYPIIKGQMNNKNLNTGKLLISPSLLCDFKGVRVS